MKLDPIELRRAASESGFSPEILEKAVRLLVLLERLRGHPFLGPRIALKGGTALNLFVFDVPRLSVDIDLNYIGAPDRETMTAERPRIEQAIQDVAQREGLAVKRVPGEHAGGKWRLTYTSTTGGPGNLEVDLNFLLRVPLWPALPIDSRSIGPYQSKGIHVLDVHELAGGKLAALLSRRASRDLFDARRLLAMPELEDSRLRLAFVVYGAANRKDWRTISFEDACLDKADVASQLVPMLRGAEHPEPGEMETWCSELVAGCRYGLSRVLPLTPEEITFIEELNDHGQIEPTLLTKDPRLQEAIKQHPALRWKQVNVRKHRGLPPVEEE